MARACTPVGWDRRAVHNAVTSSAIESRVSDPEAVALLAEFASGSISIDEYRARVVAKATSERR